VQRVGKVITYVLKQSALEEYTKYKMEIN